MIKRLFPCADHARTSADMGQEWLQKLITKFSWLFFFFFLMYVFRNVIAIGVFNPCSYFFKVKESTGISTGK